VLDSHEAVLLHAGQWYRFVAVHTADANLALTKEVARRCTTAGYFFLLRSFSSISYVSQRYR
jgi:hypothetical protein